MSGFGTSPTSQLNWPESNSDSLHSPKSTVPRIQEVSDQNSENELPLLRRTSAPQLQQLPPLQTAAAPYESYDNIPEPSTERYSQQWSGTPTERTQLPITGQKRRASEASLLDSAGEQSGDDDMAVAGSLSQSGDARSLSERRQEKKKMKRFRLTHSQTRFLTSEFTRQAHPDAAHRERLAREIPGLSPRQVQVWFQNRRAKLKRMNVDDQERMMKSRALPDEFPILQTLHSYAPGRSMLGTPINSPTDYVGSPGMGGFMSYTPPASAAELLSPASTSSDRAPYMGYMSGPLSNPQQRTNPFGAGRNMSDPYRQQPSVPRLQLHDLPRATADPGSAGGRTMSPYASAGVDHSEYQLTASGPYSAHGSPYGPVETARSLPHENPSMYTPSYPGMSSRNTSADYGTLAHKPAGVSQYPYPSPGHPRQMSQQFPPPLGAIQESYKYGSPMTPHTAGMPPSYSSSHGQQQQDFSIPQMSAPADSTSFNQSYLTRNSISGTNNGQDEERRGRLMGRDIGHQRKRSSSHPPNFPHGYRG